MIEIEHWPIFGGMVAILALLGSGVMGLKRLGLIGGQNTIPATAADKDNDTGVRDRLERLEGEVKELRIMLAETYVRRDDWVPMTSRVIAMLEEHSVMLGRLDERFRLKGNRDAE